VKTHHPENERIKRDYLLWLGDAEGQAEATLDSVAAAIRRFETYTGFKSFKTFRPEQAVAFKRRLVEERNARTGAPLSKATLYATLKALRAFFQWLSRESGYRSRLSFSDASYFNLGQNEVRIATAERQRPTPTLEQIRHVLSVMPVETPLQRRNRALVAFTALTGARDGATASFRLKHIDTAAGVLSQDAREVRTKARKTFSTWFFPIGEDIKGIVAAWVEELIGEHLFGPGDPLFPATQQGLDDAGLFTPVGFKRETWESAQPIRDIFRHAFRSAGLPYFNPHSFRNMLVDIGERTCRTPEEFKAWSQNLGHERVLTTFTSYGKVAPSRQAELIRGLGDPEPLRVDAQAFLQRLIEEGVEARLRKSGV